MHTKTKKTLKSVAIIAGVSVATLTAAAGAYLYGAVGTAHRTADSAFAPVQTAKKPAQATKDLNSGKPFSILIMGVDSRDDNLSGRSDTMIVATVNKERGINMVSIPRDTYVEGTTINKINSAYADGGAENAMKHVNTLLDMKLDHYMTMNFEGLVKMVDQVGGIEVSSPIEFTTSHTTEAQGMKDYHFNEGVNKLDGKSALAYSRERYNDPRGDYGRQTRQGQVITAVLKKLQSAKTLMQFNDIFNIIGDNVKTDLTWDNMTTLFSDYRSAMDHISQNSLKGDGKMINGLSYQVVSTSELARVKSLINTNLNN